MSFFVRCDYAECDAVRPVDWDSGPKDPSGWRSFTLDDVCLHGCCPEHLELARAALADTQEALPLLRRPA